VGGVGDAIWDDYKAKKLTIPFQGKTIAPRTRVWKLVVNEMLKEKKRRCRRLGLTVKGSFYKV